MRGFILLEDEALKTLRFLLEVQGAVESTVHVRARPRICEVKPGVGLTPELMIPAVSSPQHQSVEVMNFSPLQLLAPLPIRREL